MSYCDVCKKKTRVLLPDGRRCAKCKRMMDNSNDKYCKKCAEAESVCQLCGEPIRQMQKGFFGGAGFKFS